MSTASRLDGCDLFLHDGSWRNRKAASRDRRAEARRTEAYWRSTLRN